jgi:hypothetical protein
MNTIDRINRLIGQTPLGSVRVGAGSRLHSILNSIDSAIGADTEWVRKDSCRCSAHINGACGNRRAVGARVKMLEEITALNDLKQQFAV